MKTKSCSACGQELPATKEYFNADKHSPDGLTRQCSLCRTTRATRVVNHCSECGGVFSSRKSRKYCSQWCLSRHRSRQVDRNCGRCGKTFSVKLSVVEQGSGKYCSVGCYFADRSENAPTGADAHHWLGGQIEVVCETCEKVFPTWPNVPRKYCSRDCYYIGERSPNWQPEWAQMYYLAADRVWRETVFRRDNWTCQDCGGRGRQAHHIFTRSKYPELRYEVWNGVTLCLSCHAKVHPRHANLILSSR